MLCLDILFQHSQLLGIIYLIFPLRTESVLSDMHVTPSMSVDSTPTIVLRKCAPVLSRSKLAASCVSVC